MSDPREQLLRQALVVVDTDRGESPFGWSDFPARGEDEETAR